MSATVVGTGVDNWRRHWKMHRCGTGAGNGIGTGAGTGVGTGRHWSRPGCRFLLIPSSVAIGTQTARARVTGNYTYTDAYNNFAEKVIRSRRLLIGQLVAERVLTDGDS